MSRQFYYFPLDQLAPDGGELALARSTAPTPELFTPDASARLQSFGVQADDLLALTNGKEVLGVVHLTSLPDGGAPTWRRLRVIGQIKPFSSVLAPKQVPPDNYERFHISPSALLSIPIPTIEPATPATSAADDVPDDTPYLPFTAATRTQNLLLHGPPGTGKTWALKERALEFAIKADALGSQEGTNPRKQIDALWSRCLRHEQVAMCTFHQAYTYEEFVEGIRPVTAADGAIRYAVEDGLFKRISLLALAEGLGPSVRGLGVAARRERAREWLASGAPLDGLDFAGGRQFVLVIDEINRANVARVMGELITLIEDDKRIGGLDPTVLHLPASSTRFAVPPNLHIIGTLNTADRSIALMDVALRRRFAFEELAPNAKTIEAALKANKAPEALRTLVVDLFNTLNERVQFLHDREHRIGHAYFLKIRSLMDLRDVLVGRVIPLLQEYFFGHWTRLALALAHPMQPGGQAPAELKSGQATVLEIKKIKEKDVIGVDHDDFEDQFSVEVHPDFLKDDADWLARALLGMLRSDKPPTRSEIDALAKASA